MTLHVLRKGFSLSPTPGGGGQIVDSRTGDALTVPAGDFEVLSAVNGGLDSLAPGTTELLQRYGPFFVVATESAARTFYELDIEDAPTLPTIPRVAPVTVEHRAVEPLHPSAFPSGELELKQALAAAQEADEPMAELLPLDEPLGDITLPPLPEPAGEVTVPDAEVPVAPGQLLSQEENLRLALESQPTEPMNRQEVQALIVDTAKELEAPPPSAPAPAPSRRPVVLTVVGVLLLAAGVAASFLLRPNGETTPTPPPEAPVRPPPVATVDAAAPEPLPVPVEGPDAGVVEPVVDAGLPAPEVLDAGAPPLPELDAGSTVVPVAPEGAWQEAEVQARGRVKMGEVTAPGDGEVSWTVEGEQRVKARQVLGTLARGDKQQPLTANSVGLAVLKQPTGASVKRGEVLAEIIYFEAWARALVTGPRPKPTWQCEVVSASAGQRAPCKISVVASKGAGAMVTVAVEPRWFDTATDAVLRLAPP